MWLSVSDILRCILRELYGEAAYTWYFIFVLTVFYFIRFRMLSVSEPKLKSVYFFHDTSLPFSTCQSYTLFCLLCRSFFGALGLSIYFARDSLKTFQGAIKRLLSVKKIVIFALHVR